MRKSPSKLRAGEDYADNPLGRTAQKQRRKQRLESRQKDKQRRAFRELSKRQDG